MNQFIFGDYIYISCFFAKRSSANITRWGKQTKSRKILDGLLFLYCCRSVKMFFPSFTLRKFLRDVISTPEFFFGLLRIAHEFIIRGRNKGLYKNVFPWGCFNNNIIQITYFEKYETRKPALIISNYYRRYFPAYEWSKMEKCMG